MGGTPLGALHLQADTAFQGARVVQPLPVLMVAQVAGELQQKSAELKKLAQNDNEVREAQRLRENSALGRDATDGETPIVQPRTGGSLF